MSATGTCGENRLSVIATTGNPRLGLARRLDADGGTGGEAHHHQHVMRHLRHRLLGSHAAVVVDENGADIELGESVEQGGRDRIDPARAH